MLARLGHHPVVGGHNEQEGVHAGGAGYHVFYEAFVAGHVHEAGAPAAREVQLGVARHDGDAAPVFFLQPVRVLAGHVAHQRGLAVVHVPGGPDGERYRLVVRGHARPPTRPPRPRPRASSRRATATPRPHAPPQAPPPSSAASPTPRRRPRSSSARRTRGSRTWAACRRRSGRWRVPPPPRETRRRGL